MATMKHTRSDIWEKVCSKCRVTFSVTAKTWDEARQLFLKDFRPRNRPDHPGGDDLYSQCRSCSNNTSVGRIAIISRQKQLDDQGGICQICDKKISFENNSANVDHCHTTLMVRGILCTKCNVAMHHIDNHGWLARALIYRDTYLGREPLHSIAKPFQDDAV